MPSDNPVQLNVLTADASLREWMQQLPSFGGEILIDKPLRWTSFDVIRALRPFLPKMKVGHTGTLDPLATGLLILCVGKATRLVPFFQKLPKEYRAVVKLGATTATDDREAPEEVRVKVEHIDSAQLTEVLQRFVGTIWQIPPAYSAIKLGGRRSYQRVRQGESVQLEPRQVQIFELALEGIDPPFVHLRVRCGRGVYIRSLARDLGEAMGTGGYLYALRRIAIGPYQVERAMRPEQLISRMKQEGKAVISQ